LAVINIEEIKCNLKKYSECGFDGYGPKVWSSGGHSWIW